MSIVIKNKRFQLSRRTLLRGLLGGAAVSVALPYLEIFDGGSAMAQAGGFPKRFVLFFWGNGTLPDYWTPTGEGTDWQLSDQLAPLAPVKDLVTVVSGMSVKVPNRIPHFSGAGGFLSGMHPLGEEGDNTFAGPSIDQVIAAAIGGKTLYRSIEFGAHPGDGVSYNGPYSRNPPEASPILLFERIFGPSFRAPGEDPIIDPKIGLRRSVLDAVMSETTTLKGKVGASDQQRLEQHLEGIRDLERRLALLEEDPPNLASCARPEAPPQDMDLETLSRKNRVFCDLAAMAMACDQTRVMSNFITHPVDNYVFPGTNAGHHQLTHDEPGEQPQVHQVVVQVMEEFAYFVGKLNSIQEGDGTLLDHLVMLGTSEISLGRTHSLEEYPILLAGSAGGVLRQGIHYRSTTRENASLVSLSLLRSLDILRAEWGADEALVTQGLSAIEV